MTRLLRLLAASLVLLAFVQEAVAAPALQGVNRTHVTSGHATADCLNDDLRSADAVCCEAACWANVAAAAPRPQLCTPRCDKRIELARPRNGVALTPIPPPPKGPPGTSDAIA